MSGQLKCIVMFCSFAHCDHTEVSTDEKTLRRKAVSLGLVWVVVVVVVVVVVS